MFVCFIAKKRIPRKIIVLLLKNSIYLIYNRDVSRAINPETFTVDPSLDQTTMSTNFGTIEFIRIYSIDVVVFFQNYKLCSVHF